MLIFTPNVALKFLGLTFRLFNVKGILQGTKSLWVVQLHSSSKFDHSSLKFSIRLHLIVIVIQNPMIPSKIERVIPPDIPKETNQ